MSRQCGSALGQMLGDKKTIITAPVSQCHNTGHSVNWSHSESCHECQAALTYAVTNNNYAFASIETLRKSARVWIRIGFMCIYVRLMN